MTRKILPILKRTIPEQDEKQTLLIMSYEFGDAVKCYIYNMRNPEHKVGYDAEMKISLSDLLAQINLICEMHNWDFNEVVNLGLDRFTDKVTEYSAKRDKRNE